MTLTITRYMYASITIIPFLCQGEVFHEKQNSLIVLKIKEYYHGALYSIENRLDIDTVYYVEYQFKERIY